MEPLSALRAAHEAFTAELSGTSPRRNTDAIGEKVRRLVDALRSVPEWAAELDRRASFIKRSCGDGTPWRKVGAKVAKQLPDRLQFDDPATQLLESVLDTSYLLRSRAGVVKQLRKRGHDNVCTVVSDLEEVQKGLGRAIDSKGLSKAVHCGLNDWLRQTDQLLDEARVLRTDGCWFLIMCHGDLRENRTKPSGVWHAVELTPDLSSRMLDAATSLLDWAAEHSPPPTVNPEKGKGKGGPGNKPKPRKKRSDPKDDKRVADAYVAGGHRTEAACATALSMATSDVHRARDRHRKRQAAKVRGRKKPGQ